MRSSEYWRRRAELLTQQIENGEKVPIQRIIRLYKAAFEEIDADIRKIQSASDAVNKAELAALKRELAGAAAAAPDPVRMRAIQNSISAYNFRIDRAELLKQRAYAHLMKAAGRAAEIIKPLLKNTYKAARYGTIDDIASGLDCGVDFSLVPERTINKIIEAPFHGKNYSQRVWDNTAETAGKAQKILTQGMVKGESYSKMARSLSKLCNNTFYNSFRLISTEAAHFTEEGRFDAYNDLGIDKYTYYATLGSKTCDVCGALDGQTFDTSAAREGKNKPPIHPHCRCYTVIGDVKLKSRLARDPVSGKNYKVRGDMTYNEWIDSLSNEQRMAIKAYRNRHGDMKQYRKYIDRLGDENMPKTFDLFQKMKYNETEKWRFIKLDYYRQNMLVRNPDLALPNAAAATVDNRKFTHYLFGGTNEKGLAKGRAFTSRLGYDINNYDELKQEMLKAAKKYPSLYKDTDDFGDRYEQKIVLYGFNNTPANVVLGWKTDGENTWMTTSYIKEV